MSITKIIGTRLCREFAKDGKTVVTEMIDGKTFTNVVDQLGNTIYRRVKKIERYNVGDKTVITKTCIGNKDPKDSIIKRITDRVYNQNDEFLGARSCVEEIKTRSNGYTGYKHTYKQSVNDTCRFFKYFDPQSGKVTKKVSFYSRPGSSKLDNTSPVITVDYNSKGLPYPQSVNFKDKTSLNNSTLAGMRGWHLSQHPELPYAQPGSKLEHVDKREIVLPKINYLDEYL